MNIPNATVEDMDQGMTQFTTALVDSDVEIVLNTNRLSKERMVAIAFDDDRVTLECYDVQSLERLRDLADEGARRLRAAPSS